MLVSQRNQQIFSVATSSESEKQDLIPYQSEPDDYDLTPEQLEEAEELVPDLEYKSYVEPDFDDVDMVLLDEDADAGELDLSHAL